METYIKNDVLADDISIRQGEYYNKIHQKHIENYGDFGADNIRDNILSTYKSAMRQLSDPQLSNNLMLVGKVQSGKTSNLELFTALAFDNGYNFVVIYGGYDSILLEQTTTRFKLTFDVPGEMNFSNDSPVIFSSDDSDQLLSVDNDIIEDLIEARKPIFIISMKRPLAMNKVNDLLSRIDTTQLKAFIIDDEGDQASLNTKKNKEKDASATYKAIVDMKDLLSDPLYLSVTATPQALIFLDKYSRLRPDGIRLIEPGKGYCGADCYHLYDSSVIEIIPDEDQMDLSEGVLVDSLENALKHFIISSAIMYKRGIKMADMIIHSHRTVSNHSSIYRSVNAFVERLKDEVKYDDQESLLTEKKTFEKAYNRFFAKEVVDNYKFDDLWTIICSKVLSRVYLILKNSEGKVTQKNEGLRKYKIYIGGDLLQRGVTFKNLVTTYFSRWAKDGGNMDTNLQRARWFGYREKWIDLCKLFTSETISREFTNLSEMETDLWEQFFSIQKGEMSIDDILLKAEDTKQKPTRRNVASYNTVSFKNKWIKQRVGVFDLNQIKANNKLVDDFIALGDYSGTSAGRTDGKTSAKYAIYDRSELTQLIEHMQMVFDLEPFEKKPLRDLIDSSGSIPIILMNDLNGDGRKRSFYSDNKIYALQQGADNKDKSKALYLGDSHVIVDENSINVQIHKITPKKKNAHGDEETLADYTQYMFAIYVPKEKKYFVRG